MLKVKKLSSCIASINKTEGNKESGRKKREIKRNKTQMLTKVGLAGTQVSLLY